MATRTGRIIALLLTGAILVAACDASAANGPFTVSISPGLHPRLSAEDAVRITRDYLADQTPQIAAPELHVPPQVTSVSAVTAANAQTLDGCIPPEQSDEIVWVTEGQGDYLNLRDHPWSPSSHGHAMPIVFTCDAPGPAGTIVIDDATGQILGVYPTVAEYPHPSPAPGAPSPP